LMPKYAELIYNGFWFAPEREMLQAAIDHSQEKVSGTVRMKLYRGQAQVVGRKSPNSLYSERHVTFEDDAGAYDQRDAGGFIKLNALRQRLLAQRDLGESFRNAASSSDIHSCPLAFRREVDKWRTLALPDSGARRILLTSRRGLALPRQRSKGRRRRRDFGTASTRRRDAARRRDETWDASGRTISQTVEAARALSRQDRTCRFRSLGRQSLRAMADRVRRGWT